jgi:hypothetical protein
MANLSPSMLIVGVCCLKLLGNQLAMLLPFLPSTLTLLSCWLTTGLAIQWLTASPTAADVHRCWQLTTALAGCLSGNPLQQHSMFA